MRSRARQERRLLQEQETPGALRDIRREQEKLGAQSNVEVIVTKKDKRQAQESPRVESAESRARRTARPGKPLKR